MIEVGDKVKCKDGFSRVTAGQGYHPNRVFVVGGTIRYIDVTTVIWPSKEYNYYDCQFGGKYCGVWSNYLDVVNDNFVINAGVESFKFE